MAKQEKMNTERVTDKYLAAVLLVLLLQLVGEVPQLLLEAGDLLFPLSEPLRETVHLLLLVPPSPRGRLFRLLLLLLPVLRGAFAQRERGGGRVVPVRRRQFARLLPSDRQGKREREMEMERETGRTRRTNRVHLARSRKKDTREIETNRLNNLCAEHETRQGRTGQMDGRPTFCPRHPRPSD